MQDRISGSSGWKLCYEEVDLYFSVGGEVYDDLEVIEAKDAEEKVLLDQWPCFIGNCVMMRLTCISECWWRGL